MKRWAFIAVVLLCTACHRAAPPPYLFVWAGDSAGKASDFLGVINADPASPQYGAIVASVETGTAGTHPHHTEPEMPISGHLLANGFHAGRTWLFDLSKPTSPRVITSFGDKAGFSHPHTFVRLASGNVLATFQYLADSAPMTKPMSNATNHAMMSDSTHRAPNKTGGLVILDERGQLIKSGAASDPENQDRPIYPYSALPIPSVNRIVSTTTDMDESNVKATSEWVQIWRLSDLKLFGSIALRPGPRGDENQLTGEPRLLPDGKSVYIHTFNCGLYLLRGVDGAFPTTKFVRGFQGKNCGVPVLAGHYWLQPVPELHAIISLDVTDPEHPNVVSTLKIADDEAPHWLAIDGTGTRLVVNSSGSGTGNRLYVVNFDAKTGQLALDARFRDAGSDRPGVSMTGKTWPHGFTGKAVPHGTVFSR